MTPNQAYKLGADLTGWYDGLQSTARIVAGKHATLFLAFLASTSPQRKVYDNVQLAFRALEQHKAGESWRGFMGKCHTDNLARAQLGLPLRGPKVKAFYQNILGDPNHVTVDRWIARLYGRDKDKSGMVSPVDVRYLTKRIQREARHKGITPRQYQAALWSGIKRASGLLPGETLEPLRETIMRVHHQRMAQTNLF